MLCFGIFLLAGCETTSDRLVPCPVLRGQGASYGALIGTGSFAPGACIEVFDDGHRLAHTNVSSAGTFALQFSSREFRDDSIQLRITGGGARAVEYTVHVNDRQNAEIVFTPGTVPIMPLASGEIRVVATLRDPMEREHPFTSPPISSAWLANWSTGVVSPMAPVPVLGREFDSRVPGHPLEPVAPVSRHGEGQRETGGCYWPFGAGFAFGCTQEDWDRGSCRGGGGTCTRRRGCEPLMVEEPERPAPFNQADPIPQGLPERMPYDAGPPDAYFPPPDAFGDAGGVQ